MLKCAHCGGRTGKFVEEFGVMVHERPMDCVGVLKEQITHMEYKKQPCDYCHKKRPYNELKLDGVYVNGRYVEKYYCADDCCAQYAQMSAEG